MPPLPLHCIALALANCYLIGIVAAHVGHARPNSDSNRALLLSFDGFRWDYLRWLRNNITAGGGVNYFDTLINAGAHVPDGVENVFATKTFPNHWTMATGLYEESHGILDNAIWDPVAGRSVNLVDNYTVASYFGGEPLWVTYGRQRGVATVACYMWIGCEFSNHQIAIPAVVPYHVPAFDCDYAQRALSVWARAGVRLMIFYFDQPDAIGHRFGPSSEQVHEMLLRANECLGSLLRELADLRLFNVTHPGRSATNVIVTSDHGMTEFAAKVHVPTNDELYVVRMHDYSEMMLDARTGRLDEAVDYLRDVSKKNGSRSHGFRVFKKADIPKKWHYAHSRRVADILIVADLGVLLLLDGKHPATAPAHFVAGHGYDNAEADMRPMFVAAGPDIVKNDSLPADSFQLLDVYLLLCTMLHLAPAPNNGSIHRVWNVLKRRKPVASDDGDRWQLDSVLGERWSMASLLSVALSLAVALVFCAAHAVLKGRMRGDRAVPHPYRSVRQDDSVPMLSTAAVALTDGSDSENDWNWDSAASPKRDDGAPENAADASAAGGDNGSRRQKFSSVI